MSRQYTRLFSLAPARPLRALYSYPDRQYLLLDAEHVEPVLANGVGELVELEEEREDEDDCEADVTRDRKVVVIEEPVGRDDLLEDAEGEAHASGREDLHETAFEDQARLSRDGAKGV